MDELSAEVSPPNAYTLCPRGATAGSWRALGSRPIVRSTSVGRGFWVTAADDGGVVLEAGGCVLLGWGDEDELQAAAAGIRHRQSRSVGKRMRAGG